jgi:hypothetical protein
MADYGPLGGVKIAGFISPGDTTDTYAVIDTILGIDGLRNYSGTTTEVLSGTTVPLPRRRAGMIVGVEGGDRYFKLKDKNPWDFDLTDWEELNFSGGGSGSAITGGTYSAGTLTLVNGSGDTITVTGFSSDNIFTGNTSGDCITELWVKNISGCTGEDLHIGVQSGQDIYFDSTGSTTSPSLYINSKGQIGVGTNTPFSWAINDGTGIEIHNDSTNDQIPLAFTELGTRRFFFETDFANTSNPVHIKGSSGTNLMTFNTSSSSARVGVGTTVPDGTFQVAKAGSIANQTKYPDETNIVINNTSNGFSGSTGPNSAAFRFDHGSGEDPGALITSKRLPVWDSGEKSTTLEFWNASGETLFKRIEIMPDGHTTISGNTFIGGNLRILDIGSGTSITNLGVDINGNVVSGETSSGSFTGNTSGDCITDLFVSNIFGCSDLNIEPSGLSDVYMVENGGSVSIGTTTIYSPTGTGVRTPFQVSMGDSGIPFSGLPIATTALFESDVPNSIGLVSPNVSQIYFGTPSDAFGASIRWDYPNKEFLISTNNTSGSTVFQTNNGVEAARIDENGYFGIGTDSPQFTLDVAGETRLSGSAQNILSVIGSGDTSPIFSVEGSVGELLTVNDGLNDLLFAVNDISGLPTLQVFDNDTVLMGNNLSPSLNSTNIINPGTGLSTIYSLPISAYTGAWFEYTVKNTGGARAGQIMSIFSGNTVNFTETTTTDIGSTSDISFSMSADSVNSILQVSATTTGWEIKTIVRSI